jgi:hypothetical protein
MELAHLAHVVHAHEDPCPQLEEGEGVLDPHHEVLDLSKNLGVVHVVQVLESSQ